MAGQQRSTTIDVDSAAFMRGLKAALDKLELKTERALTVVGYRVQNAARELCPVDTGRLRSSIQMTKGKDSIGPYVEIGTNVDYAAYVEFGTSRAAAQPFLRPAFAEGVGMVPAAIRGA